MTIQYGHLSASTDGRGIKIGAVATPGTLIHQAINATNRIDRVWLFLYNSDAADIEVTLELGGVTVPDDLVLVTIEAKKGKFLVLDGDPYQNDVKIAAFAVGNADKVIASGQVHRSSTKEAFN